jgi:anti-sigma B factor antagonist
VPLNRIAVLACERRAVAPDHQRVVASGEVDLFTGPRLIDALHAAQTDARHVELDLGGTTFMDMSGVRILLAAAEHARAAAGTFEIVNATASVARILALTGADRTLVNGARPDFPPTKGAGDGARAAPPLAGPHSAVPAPFAVPAARSAS